MIVGKEKLKKKLLKNFDSNTITHCSICGQVIAKYDIEDEKFEYCKSKLR